MALFLGQPLACAPGEGAPLPTASLFPNTQVLQSDTADTGEGEGESEVAEPPPLASIDAISAAVQTILVDAPPNGRELIALFVDLVSRGDLGEDMESCPGIDLAFTTPTSSCTASTGWTYFGFAPYSDDIREKDGQTVHYVGIDQASFTITGPDGRTFSAGGGFTHIQETESESHAWTQAMMGTFLWSGDIPAWIHNGTQVGWHMAGERHGSHHTLHIEGPVAVGDNWLYIEAIDWDNTVCDGIPTAAIRVRDDVGRWYRWTSGQECDPCGEVVEMDSETSLGEMCIDLAAALATLDSKNDFPETP